MSKYDFPEIDGDHQAILKLLYVYLDAIYDGNATCLGSTFHPAAAVFGHVNGEATHRTVAAYLAAVAGRASPASQGEPYRMSILSIDVLGAMASAKVRVRMFGFDYYNFLSLLKVDGNWLIANKLYTHHEEG
ncbi:nuclear transport factor 2 family protein [Cupriavidus sp. 2TAF22]|uniref:nuclear transport factor 2 family protein n=1 Tax=unclassified Cupriavidus TaxID=2640874 RepID=UPI003F90CE0A